MDDLRARLANRVQLTTDGHKAYLAAVEGAFGDDADSFIVADTMGASFWDHDPAPGCVPKTSILCISYASATARTDKSGARLNQYISYLFLPSMA